MAQKKKSLRIDSFRLDPGYRLAGKYQVVSLLGAGWEGEVYKVREVRTGIERAAKLFFPQRNPNNKTSRFYAQKLHRLRQCSMLIQYHTEEIARYKGIPVTVFISEYVEGELLSDFIKSFPGRRLSPFVGLHLLYALAKGIEEIHLWNEYHGDLHAENVIVNRFGLAFELKLLDLFRWESSKKESRQDDLCDLIRIFYESIGGAKRYSTQPDDVKYICCGLRRSLIADRFRTVSRLREYLEGMELEARRI